MTKLEIVRLLDGYSDDAEVAVLCCDQREWPVGQRPEDLMQTIQGVAEVSPDRPVLVTDLRNVEVDLARLIRLLEPRT